MHNTVKNTITNTSNQLTFLYGNVSFFSLFLLFFLFSQPFLHLFIFYMILPGNALEIYSARLTMTTVYLNAVINRLALERADCHQRANKNKHV